MINARQVVSNIVQKYNGYFSAKEFSNFWSELYESADIVGTDLSLIRDLPDGSKRSCTRLQYKDGSDSDFKLVMLITPGEFKNNYTMYLS